MRTDLLDCLQPPISAHHHVLRQLNSQFNRHYEAVIQLHHPRTTQSETQTTALPQKTAQTPTNSAKNASSGRRLP